MPTRDKEKGRRSRSRRYSTESEESISSIVDDGRTDDKKRNGRRHEESSEEEDSRRRSSKKGGHPSKKASKDTKFSRERSREGFSDVNLRDNITKEQFGRFNTCVDELRRSWDPEGGKKGTTLELKKKKKIEDSFDSSIAAYQPSQTCCVRTSFVALYFGLVLSLLVSLEGIGLGVHFYLEQPEALNASWLCLGVNVPGSMYRDFITPVYVGIHAVALIVILLALFGATRDKMYLIYIWVGYSFASGVVTCLCCIPLLFKEDLESLFFDNVLFCVFISENWFVSIVIKSIAIALSARASQRKPRQRDDIEMTTNHPRKSTRDVLSRKFSSSTSSTLSEEPHRGGKRRA